MSGRRLLVLHAGTHKTASTYIQNCLWSNRNKLQEKKVFLLAPETRKIGRYHRLATHIANRRYRAIRENLLSVPEEFGSVVVSDERLTGVLTNVDLFDGFLKSIRKAGFRLRIVLFLRDQPDYINSLYVQEIRRFYHSQGIDKYVRRCLEKRANRFDYYQMFSGLIANPLVKMKFLPFGSGYGDPFLRLMEAQGWQHECGWNPATAETINDQIGSKGVWLARQVSRQLRELGVEQRVIKGQSRYIRDYSDMRGWSRDRYYGINQDLITQIRRHYKKGNNLLAGQIWGCRWNKKFPWPERETNVFDISGIRKRKLRTTLRSYVDQVVEDIRNERPLLFNN